MKTQRNIAIVVRLALDGWFNEVHFNLSLDDTYCLTIDESCCAFEAIEEYITSAPCIKNHVRHVYSLPVEDARTLWKRLTNLGFVWT